MPAVAEEPPKVSGPGSGVPAAAATHPGAERVAPGRVHVSIDTVEECLDSATFWARHLGSYAASMRMLADRYAIAASLLGTATGLTIWTTATTSAAWWSQFIAGAMAIAVAFVAIVPKIRGYGDCAVNAASLATEYGHVKGQLKNVRAAQERGDPNAPTAAEQAVLNFEAIKARKDALKPYPKDLEDIKYGRKPQPR